MYNIGNTVSCISRRPTCMTFLFGSRQISRWVVNSCLKHTTKWGNWLFSTITNIQEQAIVKTDLWLLENAPSTMTPWPLPLSCCQQWPVRIIVSSQTYLKTDFLKQYFRPWRDEILHNQQVLFSLMSKLLGTVKVMVRLRYLYQWTRFPVK